MIFCMSCHALSAPCHAKRNLLSVFVIVEIGLASLLAKPFMSSSVVAVSASGLAKHNLVCVVELGLASLIAKRMSNFS